MPTIGITGSFGTGKSTVARLLAKKGARVIDADRIAHQVIRKGSSEYKRIIYLFGKNILNKKGEIDRKRLAEVAFSRRLHLNRLCQIIHPVVVKKIRRQIRKLRRRFVIIDAPLLIEAGLTDIVDKIIVVWASRINQIKRLRLKSGLSSKQVLQRIKVQMPLDRKKKMADFIIDNNGSLKETKLQVEGVWKMLEFVPIHKSAAKFSSIISPRSSG